MCIEYNMLYCNAASNNLCKIKNVNTKRNSTFFLQVHLLGSFINNIRCIYYTFITQGGFC